MTRALMMVAAVAALGACATTGAGVKRDEPQIAKLPVATGCVSGERPAAVTPLNSRYTAEQWGLNGRPGLTVKQKAALVSAQALRRQSYGEALNAATSACR